MMSSCDVTIIGAGPYGLAAAAHLATISGLELRVFGQAMSFWSQNMPSGMLLRSNWTATQIASPRGFLSLEAFQVETGRYFETPIPLEEFVRYGRWYQQRAVPGLDGRQIVHVEPTSGGFRITVADGESFKSRRVIIAAGISAFAVRPPEFRDVPKCLLSHTSEHCDLRSFADKRVVVVGGGQSALESAALLYEAGAEVEVIARTSRINWLQGWASKALHHRLGRFTSQLLYAPTDVGPAGISQLMARPDVLRRLPHKLQEKLRKRATRPAGARWLVDRLSKVPIQLGRSIVAAEDRGGLVGLRLDDGTDRSVDHVLVGTGFHVNIDKYDFLAPELRESISRSNGYPILREGLETSVPGLHFVGAPAARSFGPLLQFVSGAGYASRSLLQCIAKR